jgi:hypothetical protein
VGVTLGETDIVEEVEGVEPNDKDAVAVKEIVGVIDDVSENDAPVEKEGVVDGVIEGVFVAELEAVCDDVGLGATTRVNPVDESVYGATPMPGL